MSEKAAAKEIKNLREKNWKLKKDLDYRPTPEKVLERFRGTPTYYEELNDKAVLKIKLWWKVASSYLAESLGGDVNRFVERYINLEEKIHLEKLASGATDVAKMIPENIQSAAPRNDVDNQLPQQE